MALFSSLYSLYEKSFRGNNILILQFTVTFSSCEIFSLLVHYASSVFMFHDDTAVCGLFV